jgi:pilus assembly protein CpaB
MQDVVVLATGVNVVNNIPRIFEMDSSSKNIIQTTLTGDTKYTTLTIEASPKEAQDLIYLMATSPGNIYFTLRNPNDRQVPPRMPASNSETVMGRSTFVESAPSVAPMTPPVIAPQPVAPTQQQRPTQLPQKRNGFRTL